MQSSVVLILVLFLLLLSCGSPEPEVIRYGEDECAYCRMRIVENQFGSELVTNTGRNHKFDSIECLAAFQLRQELATTEIHSRWVTDYLKAGELLNLSDAILVHSTTVRSPMALGFLAFASRADAEANISTEDRIISFQELSRQVDEAWGVKEGQ